MRRWMAFLLGWMGVVTAAWSQALLTGRLTTPREEGSQERIPVSAVQVFGSLTGSDSQAVAFRTWKTQPAGWYRISGGAGNYTVLFSTPAHFMRPLLLTNIFLGDGQTVNPRLGPRADYGCFGEAAWDRKGAGEYDQTFVARGTGVTQVGFRLAHDGVDGAGPGAQDLVVSIHRVAGEAPAQWPRVGPEMPVLDVDSGGAKNYIWSAGFNSGEVPLTPGQTYAVRLRARKAGGVFQPFWMDRGNGKEDCYRVGPDGAGWQGKRLWMSVGTDGDGLLIPYNKRIHKQFVSLTKFQRKWSQTYVAQGRGLAGVILYAACSGIQPSQNRQRVAVRVREGGPEGPLVGISKIAIGNANYTGDASWGTFGAAFAPGEVPLEPGKTYALEFESIENYETLHGFVNIKKQVSDDRPGFNPYRKHPLDPYEKGRAFLGGTQPMDYSLDLQVIEYANARAHWDLAVEEGNRVVNGELREGRLAENPAEGKAEGWSAFTVDRATVHQYLGDGADPQIRLLRLTGPTVDGGYVQRVEGLTQVQTYRLSAKVRCSWPVDDKRQCLVGYDPTGQTEDPAAATIVWMALPRVHGVFVEFTSEPIRPRKDAIAVFLRARCTAAGDFPFKADFTDIKLRQVRTGVP